ncbi:MAG: hypothetical protein ACHRXM_05680 [Isosphaerales bacterium]
MKVRISSLTATVRQAGKPDRLACRNKKMVAETRPREDFVMDRRARLLLTVAFLGWVLAMPAARAQAPAPLPAAATPAPATRPEIAEFGDHVQNLPAPLPAASAPASGWEPEFLKSLPQPPDQPRSLFQPAPTFGPPPPDLERPYFQFDPILDPPQWGQQPGWFSDVQLGVIHPQIFFGQMKHSVATPAGRSVLVAPGAAQQPWTVAPRLEVGYRLPSGFGGFSFSDRFFSTSGTGPFIGPAGSTTRTTRLGVNYSDWDYNSREYTPWANWEMEWRAGIRLAETWITNRVDEPFATAAAGRGVFAAGDSNYTVGAGPHFGVELDRRAPQSGLLFVAKLDIANTFTRERQLFSASTTTLGPTGVPMRGVFTQNFWQQVPILNYQVGLGWQPPRYPNVKLFVGYVYEFWWQVASNSNITPQSGGTRGFFDNQGLVFQGGVKW